MTDPETNNLVVKTEPRENLNLCIEKNLRKILQCPVCFSEVKETNLEESESTLKTEGNTKRLSCTGCGRWYPVCEGIPMMLPEHEMNLAGSELNTSFDNPPGIAVKKRKWFGWYFNDPPLVSGIEEGEWLNFSYSDVKGDVLDIGAGDRDVSGELGELTNYVSIDIIPRDRPSVVADAHSLPFKDNSFDAVIARAVMEHVENEQKVSSEAARVLKKGGIFIFSAPFYYPIHDAVDHHRFTIYSIRALADKNEFQIMRIGSKGGYFGVLASHIHQGLKIIRDYVDKRFSSKKITRRFIRFFTDISGMIIYLPFYLLCSLDKEYRNAAKRVQDRIPYVKGYGVILRKK